MKCTPIIQAKFSLLADSISKKAANKLIPDSAIIDPINLIFKPAKSTSPIHLGLSSLTLATPITETKFSYPEKITKISKLAKSVLSTIAKIPVRNLDSSAIQKILAKCTNSCTNFIAKIKRHKTSPA